MFEHALSLCLGEPNLIFKALGAACTSFLFVALGTPLWIWACCQHRAVQPIRSSEVQELRGLHQHKSSTPTMGGIVLVLSIVAAAALWGPSGSWDWWTVAIGAISMALMGAWDDLLKVRGRSYQGLSAKRKLLLQGLFGSIVTTAAFWVHHTQQTALHQALFVPWHGYLVWTGGVTMLTLAALAIFTFVGGTNAVNLTDGMDGLATGLAALGYLFFMLLPLLQLLTLPDPQSITTLAWAASGLGGCLAFLIWNRHPAKLFMGDTGSMGLGGSLCAMAILLRLELLLAILGGVFVLETLSVILQVWSFRRTGRRVFRCAPLHHHFEMGGAAETTVVYGFWATGLGLALLAGWALR